MATIMEELCLVIEFDGRPMHLIRKQTISLSTSLVFIKFLAFLALFMDSLINVDSHRLQSTPTEIIHPIAYIELNKSLTLNSINRFAMWIFNLVAHLQHGCSSQRRSWKITHRSLRLMKIPSEYRSALRPVPSGL